MNYATIKNCDIANGPGVRVSLFVLVLDVNKAERHLRGGLATKEKYAHQHEEMNK